MDVKTTYEVELELAMDEDENKTPKDICVEGCMAQVTNALTGKNFRSMLGAIKGQILAAYNAGYNEGRNCGEASEDIWRMVQTVAKYDCNELNNAFHTGEFLSDAFKAYRLREFRELYLKHDKEKVQQKDTEIRVGDEVKWAEWCEDLGMEGIIGWVTEVASDNILVVFDTNDGKNYTIPKDLCSKTGKHSEYFSKKNK